MSEVVVISRILSFWHFLFRNPKTSWHSYQPVYTRKLELCWTLGVHLPNCYRQPFKIPHPPLAGQGTSTEIKLFCICRFAFPNNMENVYTQSECPEGSPSIQLFWPRANNNCSLTLATLNIEDSPPFWVANEASISNNNAFNFACVVCSLAFGTFQNAIFPHRCEPAVSERQGIPAQLGILKLFFHFFKLCLLQWLYDLNCQQT